MNYIGLVCARGGSKGLPGKNKRLISGKSLVGLAVAKAKSLPRITSVLISTDCPEIAELAQSEGAEMPFFRPEALAKDNSAEWDVWKHMVQYLLEVSPGFDALLVVPPTAPLRSEQDLDACLDLFETGKFDVVITVTEASRSPYFNMIKDVGNGFAELVIKPDADIVRRQDVPTVYDMTTVAYVVKPGYVMSAKNLFEGQVGYVYVPRERAIDIDTQFDYEFAQFLADKNATLNE